MTHIKIFNALLTIPFALAVGCSPDVSVEPPADMALAALPVGPDLKTATLEFDTCTSKSDYFSPSVGPFGTSIILSGAQAKSSCQNKKEANQILADISCLVSKKTISNLDMILSSQLTFLRVDEEFWLPTVINKTSVNNVTNANIVAMQGQMNIVSDNNTKTSSIGAIRASELVAGGVGMENLTKKITIVALENFDRENLSVNFKMSYSCLITSDTANLLNSNPLWTINSIAVSNYPAFQ